MIPATIEALDHVRLECRSMVTTRAALSAGATIIPLPGIDVGTDISLLVELIPAINRKFGLTPEQIDGLDPQLQKLILVAVTSVGSELIGRLVTKQIILGVLQRVGLRVAAKSTLRFVPILGQALSAGLSFTAMRLLGNAHVEDCYQVTKRAIEETIPQFVVEGTSRRIIEKTVQRDSRHQATGKLIGDIP